MWLGAQPFVKTAVFSGQIMKRKNSWSQLVDKHSFPNICGSWVVYFAGQTCCYSDPSKKAASTKNWSLNINPGLYWALFQRPEKQESKQTNKQLIKI